MPSIFIYLYFRELILLPPALYQLRVLKTILLARGRAMKLGLVAAAAMGLSLMAGSAAAQGAKIYPGTFCVGDGLAASSGISFNWGVRAENKSTAKKVVNCPVVRDGDSTRPRSATIYLYDSSRQDSVECKFQSWTADGTNRVETVMRFSGTGFLGRRSLTFPNPPTAAGSTYNFLCKLPRGSYISSYKVDEL